jgi:hypothetical protein
MPHVDGQALGFGQVALRIQPIHPGRPESCLATTPTTEYWETIGHSADGCE